MEYKKSKLKDLCDIRRGSSPRPIDEYYTDNGVPWVKISDATASRKYILETSTSIKESGVKGSVEVIVGDLILSNSGTPALPKIMGINACIHDGWLLLRNFIDIDKDYLYYYLLGFRKKIEMLSTGTIFQNLNTDRIKNLVISYPSFEMQKEISLSLSTIDNAIENNTQILILLEEYSQLFFHKWFVDFNFPNENGEPYKDSGGEMVEIDGKEIPKGWSFSNVGTLSVNFDSRRIPLSDSQRASRKGDYPYYGATKIMDYIDDYIFDGKFCLIAEDGSVMDDSFRPIMQYATGKFWVNNHTHVLQGKLVSTEFLYLSLLRTNVMGAITGAIQKKINQQNLNKLPIIHPSNEVLNTFDMIILPIFSKIEALKKENSLLVEYRDLQINKLIK